MISNRLSMDEMWLQCFLTLNVTGASTRSIEPGATVCKSDGRLSPAELVILTLFPFRVVILSLVYQEPKERSGGHNKQVQNLPRLITEIRLHPVQFEGDWRCATI